MEQLKKLMEEQGQAFEAFKKANDERLAQLEKKGSVDAVLAGNVEKANLEITRLQKEMTELSKVANRPGSTSEAENEEKEYRKSFSTWMRKGQTDARLQAKAVNVGTAAEGGYAVPEELDRAIGKLATDGTPMRAICNVTPGSEQYEKLFDVGGTTSGWVGETASRPATTAPSMASVKPSFGEVYASPEATQKSLDDIFFDVEAWLAESVGEKFATDEDAAFVSGDGVNKPKGILAYTLAATADATRAFGQIEKLHAASTSAFTGDHLITLIHKLKAAYRQNAQWVMPTLTVSYVRKLKVDENYIWQPGLTQGQPASLLGFPIVEDENVPAMAVDANIVLFGDFKRAYRIVDVKGIRSLRDPFTAKPKVVFYTTKRVGGGVEDSCAIKVLTLSA